MPLSREDQLTMSCVRYFRMKYPDELIFHVANQRKTTARRGAKLKKMGVVAGVSDLHIPISRGGYLGLVIELKYEKNVNGTMRRANYPTPTQLQFLQRMHDYGYAVAVCWNLDEFMQTVDDYMSEVPVVCEYLINNEHITEK